MIYARSGCAVTVVRPATLADVKKFEGRKPDDQDRKSIKNRCYFVIRYPDGEEGISHLAFLRADDGLNEIGEAVRAAEGEPLHGTEGKP